MKHYMWCVAIWESRTYSHIIHGRANFEGLDRGYAAAIHRFLERD